METACLRHALASAAFASLLWAPPLEARYLQVDPVGYEDQINLYAYVGNDPVTFIDRSGNARIHFGENGQVEVRVHVTIDDSRVTPQGFTAARVQSFTTSTFQGSVEVDGAMYHVTNEISVGLVSQGDRPQPFMPVVTVNNNNRGAVPTAAGNDIQVQAGHSEPQVGHEIGHAIGADDQYVGGQRIDGSRVTSTSQRSNVMTNNAPRANAQTLREVVTRNATDRNTYTCAPGVRAPGGQC